MKVTLISPDGCQHCVAVLETLDKLKLEFKDLKVEKIDMLSDEGQKLVQKHGIMASPGILVNDEFFLSGGATEDQLRKRLTEVSKK